MSIHLRHQTEHRRLHATEPDMLQKHDLKRPFLPRDAVIKRIRRQFCVSITLMDRLTLTLAKHIIKLSSPSGSIYAVVHQILSKSNNSFTEMW